MVGTLSFGTNSPVAGSQGAQLSNSVLRHGSGELLGTGIEHKAAWTARPLGGSQTVTSPVGHLHASGFDWDSVNAKLQHSDEKYSMTSTSAVTNSHSQSGKQYGITGGNHLGEFSSMGNAGEDLAASSGRHPASDTTNLLSAWRAGQNITDQRDELNQDTTAVATPNNLSAVQSSPSHLGTEENTVTTPQEGKGEKKAAAAAAPAPSPAPLAGEDWSVCKVVGFKPKDQDLEGGLTSSSTGGFDPVDTNVSCREDSEKSSTTWRNSGLKGTQEHDRGSLRKESRAWWRPPGEAFLQGTLATRQGDKRKPKRECWIPPAYPGMPKLDLSSMSKEELLDILPCPRIVFGGVFLLKESRDKLLKLAPPKHANIYCDHMTVVYKPGAKGLLKLPIGRCVSLSVVGEVANGDCQVIQVVPPSSVMPSGHAPHITMSIAEGAQPRSAVELAAKAQTTSELTQKWPAPVEFIGVVGVRLDNRSTVLSLEEFFVRTGVNLRQVRRRLAEVLRPNGVKKGGSHGKHGVQENVKDNNESKEGEGQSVITRTGIKDNEEGSSSVGKEKGQEKRPDENEIQMLVNELTQEFAGLDKHVARQLLMVSDWNLAAAQHYLQRAEDGSDDDEDTPDEGEPQEEQTEEKQETKTPIGHLKGPGILHLPFDILENTSAQNKAPPNEQTNSQHLHGLEDSSPTKRRTKQDELREMSEVHRKKAIEQKKISARYDYLAKRAQAKGRSTVAREYEERRNVHKNLSERQNKQAGELGYMASNLGKECVHIMDFHLLHAAEALVRCEKVVKKLQEFVDTVGGCLYKLKIITGRGNNSHNQTPVLRPQIMEYLSKEGYSPFLEENNPGVVCVYIEAQKGEGEELTVKALE